MRLTGLVDNLPMTSRCTKLDDDTMSNAYIGLRFRRYIGLSGRKRRIMNAPETTAAISSPGTPSGPRRRHGSSAIEKPDVGFVSGGYVT